MAKAFMAQRQILAKISPIGGDVAGQTRTEILRPSIWRRSYGIG
jgi:hypothetical protein